LKLRYALCNFLTKGGENLDINPDDQEMILKSQVEVKSEVKNRGKNKFNAKF
jgi:hypothetical protein